MDKEEIKEIAEAYALKNAHEHGGEASVDSVMGGLMNEKPDLSDNIEKTTTIVSEVVNKVNSLSLEEINEKIKNSDKIKKEEKQEEELANLPNVGDIDKVVMRFAPNPNGAATIGSIRGLILNDYYSKRYDGDLILRFDDTDPSNKPPLERAYTWWEEDANWLDVDIDKTVRASQRLDTYYEYGFKLIEKDGAYACRCSQDRFKELREDGRKCEHRSRPVDESIDELQAMVDGEYEEGEIVIRIKTEMDHPNPAVRDWVALRIVDDSHPIEGKKPVWPTLDFQSGIDDHLFGITHILRGKDLRDSKNRQKYIYDTLDWDYPETLHWGRLSIEEYGVLSTSSIAESIKNGKYNGWDDYRLPTVKALRRRGIEPEALRNVIIDLGVSEVDAEFSMEHVYAENRKLIDEKSNRYFLVRNPIEVKIEGAEPTIASIPLHPDIDRGTRQLEVNNSLFLEPGDIEIGKKIRLKHLYNIEFISEKKARYIGDDISLVRDEGIDVIHWTPKNSFDITLKTPNKNIQGKVEKGIIDQIGKTVQFERVGFSRIEEIKRNDKGDIDEIIAIFGHR